jgi:hypothetical protein
MHNIIKAYPGLSYGTEITEKMEHHQGIELSYYRLRETHDVPEDI